MLYGNLVKKKQNGIARIIKWFGEFGLFVGRTLKAGITSRFQFKELVRQMDEIGSKSTALVILTGAALGLGDVNSFARQFGAFRS